MLADATRSAIRSAGVVYLESRPHHLVWVGHGSSKDLANRAQGQEVHVGEFVLASSGRAPAVLQLLVCHELDRAVRDTEQGRHQPPVEALDTFRRPKMCRAMPYRLVCAWGVLSRRQHTRLDHPYRIRKESRQYTRSSRSKKVVGRREIPGFACAVRRPDGVLNIAVPAKR